MESKWAMLIALVNVYNSIRLIASKANWITDPINTPQLHTVQNSHKCSGMPSWRVPRNADRNHTLCSSIHEKTKPQPNKSCLYELTAHIAALNSPPLCRHLSLWSSVTIQTRLSLPYLFIQPSDVTGKNLLTGVALLHPKKTKNVMKLCTSLNFRHTDNVETLTYLKDCLGES